MAIAFYKGQEFTTAGDHTWDVPINCSGWVWVTAQGGGGGGGKGTVTGLGSALFTGGGGGGAGESIKNMPLKVTPGGTLDITVGYGGQQDGTAAHYPVHASYGNFQAGGVAENAAAGSSGDGWGGGTTLVGQLRVLGGAGGIGSSSSPHGGTGGGIASYTNQGETTSGQGAAADDDNPILNTSKHATGAGAGGGSTNGLSGIPKNGGRGGKLVFNANAAGGTGYDPGTFPAKPGAGGGGSSTYGAGSAGEDGNASNANTPAATSYGAGSGGSTQDHTPASGVAGYVLLTWLEVS